MLLGQTILFLHQWMCQNTAQMPLNFSQLYLSEVLDVATTYAFFEKLETLFASDFTKEDVVKAIKEFIPNFEHEEKGKNLDQKM